MAELTATSDAAVPDDDSSVVPAGPEGGSEGGFPRDAALAKDCTSTLVLLDAGPEAEAGEFGCNIYLPCGLPNSLVTSGCELYYAEPATQPLQARDMFCHLLEGQGCADGSFDPRPSGIGVGCFDCSGGGGRTSSGVAPRGPHRSTSEMGSYFARMAHDEAASIYAFARLRGELTHHRAPAELLRASKEAERDEVRHAKMMARWASKFGASPPVPRIRVARRPRELEAIARENAVEGCVRETFGALLNTWQSRHASDPSLRKLFSHIARDETNHAALSSAVGSWLEKQLSPSGQKRVQGARAKAIATIRRDIDRQKPSPSRLRLGLPDGTTASALLDAIAATSQPACGSARDGAGLMGSLA